MVQRIFILVLDSFGIGALPDAALFHDEGSDTLGSVSRSRYFSMPLCRQLGLFQIDGVSPRDPVPHPTGCFGRLAERSNGKDTTTGHWEIAGLPSEKPFPTYPDGFPEDLIARFQEETGRGVLCNRPYSGTAVIADYGEEHCRTGKLIVYTSADSVFQIAAHESVVPPEELYRYCRIARGLLTGEHAVGRVIARPFTGENGSYTRTNRRHDFSLVPPRATLLDCVSGAGLDCIGVGKIGDIFAGRGLTASHPTQSNRDGMETALRIAQSGFSAGLCFVNLVDFDMLYGHRNDVDGYARALSEFDAWLGAFLCGLRPSDVLFITADHGCDPATPSTDHSREYIPLLAYGKPLRRGVNLGSRSSFADIGQTALSLFGIPGEIAGESFAEAILQGTGR